MAIKEEPLSIGEVPDYLKDLMRERFLSGLKDNRSLGIYELDLFRWFRNESEATWERMDAQEKRYLQEQIATGSDEINDSGILATDYYRKRMRSSHVIFLTSLLELAMKRECDRLTIALGNRIFFNPSELKRDAWSARKVFLERHGSFQIPDDLWAPVKSLTTVRNVLVHHGGETSALAPDQLAALGNIGGIDLTRSEVGIEATYIDQASNAVRSLMELIHDKTNAAIDHVIEEEKSG